MAGKFKPSRTRKTQFTPLAIENIKPESRQFEISEPGGLRLVVGKSAKTFAYRYKSPITGKPRKLTIGQFPAMSLAKARTAVAAAKQKVQDKNDPQAERNLIQQEKRDTPTIGVLIDEFVANLPITKRSRKQDERYLREDVAPLWQDIKITSITRRDIKALISAKAKEAPIGAARLLGYIRRLFGYALENEYIEINPADHIRPPAKAAQRQRVLDPTEIRKFWNAVPEMSASGEVKLMLLLALATGQRIGEIRNLKWDDLSGSWWTVPEGISKNKLAHRVFLSQLAHDLIDKALGLVAAAESKAKEKGRIYNKSKYVFPGRGGGVMNEGSARRALERNRDLIGIDNFHVHDLRRTAASQITAAGFDRLVVGKVLNHAERGVTAIYDRFSYDADKAAAMNTWAKRLLMIAAGQTPDDSELAVENRELERQYQKDQSDGFPVLASIVDSLAEGEMPPPWAIKAFVRAAHQYQKGAETSLDASLCLKPSERNWEFKLFAPTFIHVLVTEYREKHPERGSAEASFKYAAEKLLADHGWALGRESVRKYFQNFERKYGSAKNMAERVEIDRQVKSDKTP